MNHLPSGTTHPRGLPDPAAIRFPLVPARETFELQYGRALVQSDRCAGGVPVYGTNGRCGSHDRALFTGPGVILGRKGQGPLGVEWCETDFWVIDTAYRLQPIRPDVDLRYAYFLIKFIGLNHLKDGTSNPTLSRDSFGAQALPHPPLPEQRAIAHILGTLDDKIELNRRMSETLEGMARALFQSWFVDFDPVRAKAQGRDPGLPKRIADLFSDVFVDSELGEIPEGWRVGTLREVADHPRRGVRPGEMAPSTPYIALEHMPKRCISLSQWGVADGLGSNKFEFRKGEILFGKLRPYFHKVGVAPVDGVCSTDIVVLKALAEQWFAFVLGHVSSTAFVDYTNAGSTGTRMPRTGWGEMARYPLVIPHADLAACFTDEIRPAISRLLASIDESRTLATVRDTLLPKLVSGEIRLATGGMR